MTGETDDTRLIEVAARLSVAPAGDFVALRTAAAAETADKDLAAAIKKLRKPVLAAWVVNVLASHDADALAPAADLAEEFREAADAGDARALTDLARRRRSILRELVGRAVERAGERGVEVGGAVRAAVEQTLDAALRDPDAAAAVASARLLRPIEATGVDAPDLTDAVSGPFEAATARPEPSDELAERRAARAAARAAAEARRHAESTERDLARVEDQWRAAQEQESSLEDRLASLEVERARVEDEIERVRREVERLGEQRLQARDAARKARKAAERAAD
ncbi:hypothetical protein ACIGEP_02620 [Microbacterium sp. NPDC077663]|uniref:hypothetical protein n=1 Tax=Microbacterium sp. NPDC077663 TaxID=3364189 RepID=UPI0037CB1E5E